MGPRVQAKRQLKQEKKQRAFERNLQGSSTKTRRHGMVKRYSKIAKTTIASSVFEHAEERETATSRKQSDPTTVAAMVAAARGAGDHGGGGVRAKDWAEMGDLILDNSIVAGESKKAHGLGVQRTRQRKQKQMRRGVVSSLQKANKQKQLENAMWDMYEELAVSYSAAERMRFSAEYETVSDAATAGRGSRKRSRTAWVTQDMKGLEALQERVIGQMNEKWPTWQDNTAAGLNGKRVKRGDTNGDGGWTLLGVGSDGTDAIFGEACGTPPVAEQSRCAVIKQVLRLKPVSDKLPVGFWEGENDVGIIRRAAKKQTKIMIPAGRKKESNAQWKRAEDHPSKTIDLGNGHVQWIGRTGEYEAPNPTAGQYEGEPVLMQDWMGRIKLQLLQYHRRGLITIHRKRDIVLLERPALLKLLADADYQTDLESGFLAAKSDDELRAYVLRKLNTICLKSYGDGSDLFKSWAALMQSMGVVFFKSQWKNNLTLVEKNEIRRVLCFGPHLDYLARASSSQADTAACLGQFIKPLLSQPLTGTNLGENSSSMTMEDVRKMASGGGAAPAFAEIPATTAAVDATVDQLGRLGAPPEAVAGAAAAVAVAANLDAADDAAPPPADVSLIVHFSKVMIKGDGEHVRAVVGTTGDPNVGASDEELRDGAALLLSARHNLPGDAARYGMGPGGDFKRTWAKGEVNAEEMKDEEERLYGTRAANKDLSAAIALPPKRRTWRLPACTAGNPDNASSRGVEMVTVVADNMHTRIHVNHVIKQITARLPGSETSGQRKAFKEACYAANLLTKDGMKQRDWIKLGVSILAKTFTFGDGVVLPELDLDHLYWAVSLDKLHYERMHARSRGLILEIMCCTMMYEFSAQACYAPGTVIAGTAKQTRDALLGLYRQNNLNLMVSSRLISTEQACCEADEGMFGPAKKTTQSKSNKNWAQNLTNVRRTAAAWQRRRAVNTTAGALTSNEKMTKDIAVLRGKIKGRGPRILGDGRVAYDFTADQVRSPLFLVTWLRWFPDYMLGQHNGEHVWFEDDSDEGYTDHTRATTIIVDHEAESGARMFSMRWMNDYVLSQATLFDTVKVLTVPVIGEGNSTRHGLAALEVKVPGWDAVVNVLAFLQEGGGEGSVWKKGAVAFLEQVEACRVWEGDLVSWLAAQTP
jgi:hypothetical protein